MEKLYRVSGNIGGSEFIRYMFTDELAAFLRDNAEDYIALEWGFEYAVPEGHARRGLLRVIENMGDAMPDPVDYGFETYDEWLRAIAQGY